MRAPEWARYGLTVFLAAGTCALAVAAHRPAPHPARREATPTTTAPAPRPTTTERLMGQACVSVDGYPYRTERCP